MRTLMTTAVVTGALLIMPLAGGSQAEAAAGCRDFGAAVVAETETFHPFGLHVKDGATAGPGVVADTLAGAKEFFC